MPENKWNLRKDILLNTAEAIFDFDNERQKESFCKLLYYIHLLADHMDDESFKISNGLKMDVGGRVDGLDIISQLKEVMKDLFPDQIHSHKYNGLVTSLDRYNDKITKLARSEGGINNDEKFEEHQKYVESLMKVITYYFPEMLKEENFFSVVFY